MGSTLARIMQKSNSYKYALSEDTKARRNNSVIPSAAARTDEELNDDIGLISCSLHSSYHSNSLRKSEQSKDETADSGSSTSSSAMDCMTGDRVTSTRRYSSTRIGMLSSPELSSKRKGNNLYRLPNHEDNLPSASGFSKIIEKKHIRPSSGRPKLESLASQEIRRCSSEPLKPHPVMIHRANSDQPLTVHHETKGGSPLPSTTTALTPDNKHMEGQQTERLGRDSTRQISVPGTMEETGDHHHMTIARPKTKHTRDHMVDVNKSVKGDTAKQDLSDSEEETTGTSSSTSDRLSASRVKLIRHMEYVATVMKKRMHPHIYEVHKPRFMNKILNANQVQYGYQNEKYVKIGMGEFGEVLYGRMKEDQQLVAIKAIKRDKTDMFALLQEALLLQIAGTTGFAAHYQGLAPFSVSILGDRFLDWAIICDFAGSPDGPTPYDFRHTLKAARSSHRTLQLVLDWIFTCTKVAYAVKQFHHLGMLLNDIKADNILLQPAQSGGFNPVFVDFGLASIGEGITLALEVNDSNRAKILKEYSHIAPEVLFGGETNAASDVFSLGKALSLVAEAFPVEALVTTISRCTLWNVSERPTVDEMINNLQWISRNIIANK